MRSTRLGCACKCGSEHGGGWWAGPPGVSVVGQVYERREWALPYVQSDGCCFRGRKADLLLWPEEHRSYLHVNLSLLGLPAAFPELHLR